MARVCPIKALEEVRPLGLRPEGLIAAMSVFVVGTLAGHIFSGAFIAYFVGRQLEVVLKDKPEGFVVHAISQWAGSPFAKRWLPFAAPMISGNWRRSGLVPPPSIQDTYEP